MISREANIYINKTKAGELTELDGTFCFQYDQSYLSMSNAKPISLTFPLRTEPFTSKTLPPFFCGILAEGVNKEIQCRMLKVDEKDLFGLLLLTADKDTIGAVTVKQKTPKS
jgi:HipA-like protein